MSELNNTQQSAVEKLKAELESSKEKDFSNPIVEYLTKRIEEDAGLAEDVILEHKKLDRCIGFIYDQARKQAEGKREAAIWHEAVYEWAEDYYRKDDKAEAEKRREAREEERKKKITGKVTKAVTKQEKKTTAPKTETAKETTKKPLENLKAKKAPKEMDGQMSLFDWEVE